MTTFTSSIAASADDSREAVGTNTTNDTFINVSTSSHIGGLRFQNVTIPPGSTINSAYLTLTVITSYDDPEVTIRGSGEANPAAFTTAANHLTNRAKTSANVTWDADNIGAGGKNSPELKTLVEEMIAHPSWASGNAMAFYLLGTNASSSTFRFQAYDNGSSQAQLTIDYTAPAATAAAKVQRIRLSTRVGGVLTA